MRIFWQGDFENEAKNGTIVDRADGRLTIQWDNGRKQIIPDFVVCGVGWRIG